MRELLTFTRGMFDELCAFAPPFQGNDDGAAARALRLMRALAESASGPSRCARRCGWRARAGSRSPAGTETAAGYLPRFTCLLDDLAVIDPEQLHARNMTPQAFITQLLITTARGNPRTHEELHKSDSDLRAIAEPLATANQR